LVTPAAIKRVVLTAEAILCAENETFTNGS
jgi:hypothetical protein